MTKTKVYKEKRNGRTGGKLRGGMKGERNDDRMNK
jgi:hypothetical protein